MKVGTIAFAFGSKLFALRPFVRAVVVRLFCSVRERKTPLMEQVTVKIMKIS